MRSILALVTLGFALAAPVVPALAQRATIYCANHTITVRTQSYATLRRSFADICQLSGQMDEGSASQRAGRFGGEGARCDCN